jgi:aminopeptidase N
MSAFCIDEGVSRELALERAGKVSNIRDRIGVRLEKRAARMPGHVEIRFDLAKVIDPLPLDFGGDGTARNLKVNGTATQIRSANGQILIAAASLRQGHNSIEMDFESGIAEANRAVTRYLDTTDGDEYLYTLFVPMDASLAFPASINRT